MTLRFDVRCIQFVDFSLSEGAFHLSELAGPYSELANEIGFFQKNSMKLNVLLRASHFILVQYSDKFMHGFVKFLIVLLRSFAQYCNVKTIQNNAMHKFVGVLDNPLQFRI